MTQQPVIKVPRGIAPRISPGIEAEKRRVLNRNTRSFDNEETGRNPQAKPARLLPRAARPTRNGRAGDDEEAQPCDFFTKEVWTLGGLVTHYVLFFMHVATRKVYIAGFTKNPNEQWMKQIARNVTKTPRFARSLTRMRNGSAFPQTGSAKCNATKNIK